MNDKSNLVGLGRSVIENQWHSLKQITTDAPPLYNDNGLVAENIFQWIVKNVGSLWHTAYKPFPTYSNPAVNSGIFKIQKDSAEPVTIALLSDWASNTKESRQIAQQAGINDYSIHLGDTYYVGSENEIAANFDPEKGGNWPYGTLGSFAMNGNHEMYSGGQSYFTQLLPVMGAYEPGTNMPVQTQQASFFCLENDHWRIIGLDTGYDSLTWLGVTDDKNLDLTDEQKDWLQNTVKLNEDNRGLIFLTHHQPFSAFEPEFLAPAAFLSSLITPARDVIWLWGHEHWFSVYGANKLPNGTNVYGRCIGNGGMPVELYEKGGIKKPKDPNNIANPENRNLVIYDQREREVIKNDIHLGHNGYTILTLNAAELTISYFDDNFMTGPGRLILDEKWTVDIATGNLNGFMTDHTINGDQDASLQLNLFGNALQNAVKSA
jgi:hypothetical protein